MRKIIQTAILGCTAAVLLAGNAVAASPLHQNLGKAKAAKRVKAAVQAQPAPLAISVLEGYLSTIAGRPITISCDTPGVPSPIDGRTMDLGDDGEVFHPADYATLPPEQANAILPVVHVWASECLQAQRVNRRRAQNPTGYLLYQNKRVDDISGPALEALLHETTHVMLQSTDEGLVECTAITNAWTLVNQLGLSERDAAMVAGGMYWRHSLEDPQYRTDC